MASNGRQPSVHDPGTQPSAVGPTSFLKQKAKAVLSSKKTRSGAQSTLTAAEQAALDEMWKLLEPSPSTHPTTNTNRAVATDHMNTDYGDILDLFVSESTTRSESARHDPLPSLIDEFPSPSINTSAPVLDHESAPGQSRLTSSKTTMELDDSIYNTSLNVMSDVSSSFGAALKLAPRSPDQAVWQVCEEKIFPLIQILIPPRPSLSTLSSSSSSSSPASKSSSQISRNNHPLIPQDIASLPLLKQLYPALLLLAARLFYTHLPTSPYALALLPHVKTLGPTSYVLGTSTYFYNSLINLRWDIYSDFEAIDSLLVDMERNGVEFDVGTLLVLRRIETDRQHDTMIEGNEHTGGTSRGRQWWERPEITKQYQTIGKWRNTIARQLEERGLGEVARESAEPNREQNVQKRQAANAELGESQEYVVML